MRRTTAVVIGAGHAGLAMSACLAERGVDHVVLERGEVANTWRSERWDSLRLLTPNWQSRLPGYGYDGGDPDGYRTVPEVVAFIESYARAIAAPVETGSSVTSLRADEDGYLVETGRGRWRCRSVVIATGACNIPRVPRIADAVPPGIAMLTPRDYRNPAQLAEAGVLVVGAAATGIQLAEEIHRSGRQVTLAAGEHVRAPRLYRGRDIQWWMDRAGILDQRYDTVDDIARARKVPSFQLVGTPERKTLDLNALRALGVRIRGKLAGIAGGRALFSGSLRNACALADLKMNRLLDTIDVFAAESGLAAEVDPPERFAPTEVDDSPPLVLDLVRGEIGTILWATGYRPDYSWLDLPVLDHKRQIVHDGGVIPKAPGAYVLGLQFLRRRKSALIDGAGDDARDLADHLVSYLAGRAAPAIPLPA
ncbi:MAG TPA: NAD(P)-binding domain-containing protein [Bauldia sp.]|nr:NAD(P)-binding domain-containing protein [Bauldia sp.]